MRYVLALTFFPLWMSVGHSQENCSSSYWTLKGEISKEALGYDQFLRSLTADADPNTKLNEYIHQHGLLFQLKSSSGTVQGYDNYLVAEGASGLNVGLFLKYMRVMAFSNIAFDKVYEVEKPDSKRALMIWNVPFGFHGPAAVEAFNLLYVESLVGVCTPDLNRKVTLAVSNEGIYKATARDDFPAPTPIDEIQCKAQRTLFKLSPTATCAKFKDLKSKKTRILIWDAKIK